MKALYVGLILCLLSGRAWAHDKLGQLGKSRGCLSCHGGVMVKDSCVDCHKRRGIGGKDSLYETAPELQAFNDRFTREGLRRFLRAPEPRMARTTSMFALDEATVTALVEVVRFDESSSPLPANPQRGAQLYVEMGCQACHEQQAIGPRLRLGYPLLGHGYFAAKVRGLSKRGAIYSGAKSRMPAFPGISEAELRDLYAHISTTRDQGEDKAELGHVKGLVLGRELYRHVNALLTKGSCRHCHSDDAGTQADMRASFGAEPAFRIARIEGELSLAKSDKALFHPGPKCEDSLLLERLRRRHEEWQGKGKSDLRGMPLTLPPLAKADIELIALWTKLGCPSDAGKWCRPCSP